MAARSEAKRIEGGVQAAMMVAAAARRRAVGVRGAGADPAVALVSYDRDDPAFSSTGQPGPVHNLIGPLGAWLSDLFFVLFGARRSCSRSCSVSPVAAVPGRARRASRIERRILALRGVGFRG